METFKLQLLKLQQQLSGLTVSQKMLTASLVAIMVMTILWWARYAGTAEMEPLLDQPLSVADLGQVRNALVGAGIQSTIVGDRIMVAADRRVEALAILTYNDALPTKSANVWDEMFKQMSPWDPKSKTDTIQNHAKELWLSQSIGSYFPGVARAAVTINPVGERKITGSLEPTASVMITTRGRDVNVKRLRDSVAASVASAVSGLMRKNVSVVVDGVLQRAEDPNDGISSELLERKKQLEDEDTEKILRMLPHGSTVAVEVHIEHTSRLEQREDYDPKNQVSIPRVIETIDETQRSAQQAVEPGALPNTGLALDNSAPSDGPTSTIEKSRTELDNFAGKANITINTPAGQPKVVSVAVNIPRSHYVNQFKLLNPNAKEVDPKAIEEIFEKDRPVRIQTVAKTVNLKSPDDVALTMYDDTALPMMAAVGSPETAGSGSGMGAMVSSHAREIVLGALAVISLFMVSTIVKKGAPAPPPVMPSLPRETPRLDTDETVAGIVGGDSNTTLDGMELDEDAVKSQQMVEQVATMVKENPDAAANLVKRWLNRS